MKNRITVNTALFPKGKLILCISQIRSPKGIIEKIQSLFGKTFIEEDYVESYYKRNCTIFVKPFEVGKNVK